MPYTVQVTDVSATTTRESLHSFFLFCGKIDDITVNEKSTPKSATIIFEKASAAKTALMLNGGMLDGASLHVSSTDVSAEDDHREEAGDHPIGQEDKPRSGIAAEYLAKGYQLSDAVLQKAIEMDQKHGISSRFLSYLHNLDKTLGSKVSAGPSEATTLSEKAIGTAKSIDQKQGITAKATNYYESALHTPIGQKVFAFWSTTSKQVLDIHEEARRIATANKVTAAAPAADAGEPSASGSGSAKAV